MPNKRIFGPKGQINPYRPHSEETKKKIGEGIKSRLKAKAETMTREQKV